MATLREASPRGKVSVLTREERGKERGKKKTQTKTCVLNCVVELLN